MNDLKNRLINEISESFKIDKKKINDECNLFDHIDSFGFIRLVEIIKNITTAENIDYSNIFSWHSLPLKKLVNFIQEYDD